MKVIKIFKALSDASRVRALCALQGHELCVCQLVELLGLAPSTVSKHMSILAGSGLVTSSKKGRWVYYRLAELDNSKEGRILAFLPQLVESDPQLKEDHQNLTRILALNPETLCRMQSARTENQAIDVYQQPLNVSK